MKHKTYQIRNLDNQTVKRLNIIKAVLGEKNLSAVLKIIVDAYFRTIEIEKD